MTKRIEWLLWPIPIHWQDSRDIKSAYDFQYRIFGAKLQTAHFLQNVFGCKEKGIYSELLAKTVFKKIFKKKEQDNGSRADVVTKRKKSYINDVKEGSTTG